MPQPGGFISNEFIQATLQLKPKKVFRCPSFVELDKILCILEKSVSDMETKLASPHLKISEHCEKLKNKIDITTETLIEKLNEDRNVLVAEVNEFQLKCFDQFNSNANKLESFQVQLDEHKKRLREEFYAYINKSNIDESQTKLYIHQAKIEEYKLKNMHRLIDNRLFGDKLI